MDFHGNVVVDTSNSIIRSCRVANETDHIANEILDDLGSQKEQLLRTKEKIEDTDQNLNKSRKIIRRIAINAASNKYILIGIITLEVIILVTILYLKYFTRS